MKPKSEWTSKNNDRFPAWNGLSLTPDVYRRLSIRMSPESAELISHMLPARSLDSGVVGPITGTPYAEPAGTVGSVKLYEFTMNRSDAGASKVFGYGAIHGAKIAMVAKTRTTEKPAMPRRLSRKLAQERLNKKRRCFRITEPVNRAAGASTSETDTRIEHSVQNVGDDVA